MDKQRYISELKELLTTNGEDDESIVAACDYAGNLIELNLPVIFNKDHFALLVGCKTSIIRMMMARLEKNYYSTAVIEKKSGGKREINIPAMRLRVIQRWILDNILKKMYVSDAAMGFREHRSIVTNAQNHVGKKCIINMDLKDFFPSITQKSVFNIFFYYGYTIEVSYLLSRLCTHNGKVPQGAPTSPYISNIACIKLDKRLMELAKKYSANYTRYADDITFSADSDISSIIPVVTEIIEDEGYHVNEQKTRVLFDYQRQEVTGLLVSGSKVRVNKKYIKKLKQEIYYCKKYGVDNHLSHINCKKRFYKEHIYGKAYFVNMVEPDLGKRLISELNEIDWEWNCPALEKNDEA